jgi:TIR domain
MADIFISFIHEEQVVAVAVQQLLRPFLGNRNVLLSADEWQIFAGEQWLDRIKAELQPAKVVVLLLSPRSFNVLGLISKPVPLG